MKRVTLTRLTMSRFMITFIVMAIVGFGACGGRAPLAERVDVSGSSAAGSVGAVRAEGCRLVVENGVGFVVAPGLVATVAHAVQGQHSITFDGAPAELAALDVRSDTAILRVATKKPSLGFGVAIEKNAVSVVLVGSEIDAHVLSVVTITHTDVPTKKTVVRLGFILDKPMQFGNSGAPVADASGAVVGMVYATAADTDQAAYAVASSEIQTTLALAKSGPRPLPGECA